MIYYTHDNGSRPFKVVFKENEVSIHKMTNYENNKYTYGELIKTYKPKKIFIGKSPKNKMTLFSGGFGNKFNGNSILLQITHTNYIYIGEEIFSFKTNSQIIKYISPVGNNDVPYPHAIDEDNYYYLLLEKVKLKIFDEYNDDPYSYYYRANNMTQHFNPKNSPSPIFYSGINKFYLGSKEYMMNWTPDAKNDYKRLKKYYSNNISVVYCDGKKKTLTENDYVKIMNEFNEKLKANKIEIKLIQKRLV